MAPRIKDDDEDLLQEIRDRFDYALTEWQDIRREGDMDMRYVAGDPWDPKDRAARKAANRPCLALDELGQYFNQVINDARANPIAMQFDATGDGASDEGAAFYADKAREIEYRSHAQIAYTTAYENAVQRSYGWVRLTTRHESDKSPNQEIWIEDVPNPNAIVADPDAKRPDASDIRYLFFLETHDRKEFIRRWPKARITDFSGDVAALAPKWIDGDKIQVAEYWRIEQTPKTLAQFALPPQAPQAPPQPSQGPPSPQGQPSPGQSAPGQPGPPQAAPPPAAPQVVYEFAEDAATALPPGATLLKKIRTVQVSTVKQYITNGVEILERNPWAGKYIPFASCVGKVLYLDEGAGTKRKILSMTRLARDPYMLYCYYRTAQAEVVGRATKNAAMGYEGQFRGHEEQWAKSIHEPLAFLEVRPTTEATGGQILPLPVLNNWEPPIQALEMGAEGARRAIQAAMGSAMLPTQAQRHNEKSGIALKQIDDQSQKGSFHFKDHYQDMIRHVGVMAEDLMGKIYDTARHVGVRKPDGTATSVPINNPQDPTAVSTQGDYLVTVSTGPASDSQREAASDFADQLVQNPQVFPLIASDVVRLKNLGPEGDKIADALEILKPPQLRKQPNGQAPLPPEAQQAIQENQQLKQQLQQAQQAQAIDKAKSDGQLQIEQVKAQHALELAKLNNAAKIEVARIMATKGGGDPQFEAEEEALATGLAHAHEAEMQAREHAHDVGMATLQHAAASQKADQAHQQSLEQGDAASSNAMAQQANQAALQPPPEQGAGA